MSKGAQTTKTELPEWQKQQQQELFQAGKPYPNTPNTCLLYTSPSPRDRTRSRMPSSA